MKSKREQPFCFFLCKEKKRIEKKKKKQSNKWNTLQQVHIHQLRYPNQYKKSKIKQK
jgi:hypothetical protein